MRTEFPWLIYVFGLLAFCAQEYDMIRPVCCQMKLRLVKRGTSIWISRDWRSRHNFLLVERLSNRNIRLL